MNHINEWRPSALPTWWCLGWTSSHPDPDRQQMFSHRRCSSPAPGWPAPLIQDLPAEKICGVKNAKEEPEKVSNVQSSYKNPYIGVASSELGTVLGDCQLQIFRSWICTSRIGLEITRHTQNQRMYDSTEWGFTNLQTFERFMDVQITSVCFHWFLPLTNTWRREELSIIKGSS